MEARNPKHTEKNLEKQNDENQVGGVSRLQMLKSLFPSLGKKTSEAVIDNKTTDQEDDELFTQIPKNNKKQPTKLSTSNKARQSVSADQLPGVLPEIGMPILMTERKRSETISTIDDNPKKLERTSSIGKIAHQSMLRSMSSKQLQRHASFKFNKEDIEKIIKSDTVDANTKTFAHLTYNYIVAIDKAIQTFDNSTNYASFSPMFSEASHFAHEVQAYQNLHLYKKFMKLIRSTIKKIPVPSIGVLLDIAVLDNSNYISACRNLFENFLDEIVNAESYKNEQEKQLFNNLLVCVKDLQKLSLTEKQLSAISSFLQAQFPSYSSMTFLLKSNLFDKFLKKTIFDVGYKKACQIVFKFHLGMEGGKAEVLKIVDNAVIALNELKYVYLPAEEILIIEKYIKQDTYNFLPVKDFDDENYLRAYQIYLHLCVTLFQGKKLDKLNGTDEAMRALRKTVSELDRIYLNKKQLLDIKDKIKKECKKDVWLKTVGDAIDQLLDCLIVFDAYQLKDTDGKIIQQLGKGRFNSANKYFLEKPALKHIFVQYDLAPPSRSDILAIKVPLEISLDNNIAVIIATPGISDEEKIQKIETVLQDYFLEKENFLNEAQLYYVLLKAHYYDKLHQKLSTKEPTHFYINGLPVTNEKGVTSIICRFAERGDALNHWKLVKEQIFIEKNQTTENNNEIIQKIALQPLIILKFLQQVGKGLLQIHVKGILHGDLSLRNILVLLFGSDPYPVVADLGKGRYLNDINDLNESVHESGLAQVGYSNWERFVKHEVSIASDVFAFQMLYLGLIASLAGKDFEKLILRVDYHDFANSENPNQEMLKLMIQIVHDQILQEMAKTESESEKVFLAMLDFMIIGKINHIERAATINMADAFKWDKNNSPIQHENRFNNHLKHSYALIEDIAISDISEQICAHLESLLAEIVKKEIEKNQELKSEQNIQHEQKESLPVTPSAPYKTGLTPESTPSMHRKYIKNTTSKIMSPLMTLLSGKRKSTNESTGSSVGSNRSSSDSSSSHKTVNAQQVEEFNKKLIANDESIPPGEVLIEENSMNSTQEAEIVAEQANTEPTTTQTDTIFKI